MHRDTHLRMLTSSVQSDSLRPHELQHARPPCPSPTPGVHPNPCPSNRWCHPTTSSSVIPFSSCPQSFPASGGNESAHSLSSRISSRMDWLDLLVVQRTLKSLLQHHISKASILWRSAFILAQLSHPYMTTGKTIALTRQTFVGKVKYYI